MCADSGIDGLGAKAGKNATGPPLKLVDLVPFGLVNTAALVWGVCSQGLKYPYPFNNLADTYYCRPNRIRLHRRNLKRSFRLQNPHIFFEIP